MIFPAEDFLPDAPKPGPLFAASASESEANLWTSVNGWSVARAFTSPEQEYLEAKASAVIADLGPLARYAVRGDDAAAFLGRLTTAPSARLEPGESARGLILDNNGGVVDLAEVSRLSAELFLLTTPTSHARRLQLAARGFDVNAEDISNDVAALGVFGPRAGDALAAAGVKTPDDAVAASAVIRGVETAARPIQFSALPGVEIIFPKDEALTIWERLVRRGQVTPIGLDALEMLRLESGAPRSGLDFISSECARPEEVRLPVEIGLSHLAPLDRGWFNGRRGLRRQGQMSQGQASPRRLVSLLIDDDKASPGAEVLMGGKPVGRITSCAWSPVAKRVAAFADILPPSNGKQSEISVVTPSGATVPARIAQTPESALAAAFREGRGAATDLAS